MARSGRAGTEWKRGGVTVNKRTFTLSIRVGEGGLATRTDVAMALLDVALRLLKVKEYDKHVSSDYGNDVVDLSNDKVGEWGFHDEGDEWAPDTEVV
jgi:hypothetical protein